MSRAAVVDMKEVAKDTCIVIEIKHAREWTLRLCLAELLFRLAVLVAWFGDCEIELNNSDGERHERA